MKYSRQIFAHLFVTACVAPKFFATAHSDYHAAPGGSCENGDFENRLLSVSSSELHSSVNETLTEMEMQQTKSTRSKSVTVASYSYVLGPNQDPENIKTRIKSFLFSLDIVAKVFKEEESDDIFGIDLPGVSFETLPFGPFEFAYFLEKKFQLEAAEPVLTFFDTLDVAEDEEQGGVYAATAAENICDDRKNKEWHLKHVKALEAWEFSEKEGKPSGGEGVLIAQIDTGYSEHYGAFPPDDDMWIDKKKKGLNMYIPKHKKEGRLDPKDELKSFQLFGAIGLPPGHGTIVAPHAVGRGRVMMKNNDGREAPRGTAPKAKLYSVRAVNNPIIDPKDAPRVVGAIEEIVGMKVKVDVISMSLGAPSLGKRQKDAREAIKSAIANNIIVVAAGGQLIPGLSDWLAVVYPARYDDVIAVGGYQVADRSKDEGSNPLHKRPMEWWPKAFQGEEIDIAGPANYVCNAKVYKSPWSKPKYDYITGEGTSLATAMTGGIAALWVAHHGKDNLIKHFYENHGITLQAAFKKVLELTANKNNWKDCKDKDITKGCYKDDYGHGMIDALAILKKPLTDIRDECLNDINSIQTRTSEEGAAQNHAKKILLKIGYDEDDLKLFQEDDLEYFSTELVYLKSKDDAAMSSKLSAKLGRVAIAKASSEV